MFEQKAKDFLPLGFLKFVGSFDWNKTRTENMIWTSTYSILESLQSSLIVDFAKKNRPMVPFVSPEVQAGKKVTLPPYLFYLFYLL